MPALFLMATTIFFSCTKPKQAGVYSSISIAIDGKDQIIAGDQMNSNIPAGGASVTGDQIEFSLGAGISNSDGRKGWISISAIDSSHIKAGAYSLADDPYYVKVSGKTQGWITIIFSKNTGGGDDYYSDNTHTGTVTITSIKNNGGQISGSFECALREYNGTSHTCSGTFTDF